MSPEGALLAFGAALAFSGFDVTRKQAGEHVHPFALTAWLQVVSLPFFVTWVAVEGPRWSWDWWWPGLGSVLIQAAANAAFLTALKIAPLSKTVPFLALTPAFSAGWGWALLGETPTPMALVGIALVTAGAFALAVQRTPGGGLGVERGSLLTVAVAAAWSGGSAVDKLALATASASTHALLITFGVLVVFVVERTVRAGPRSLALAEGSGRWLLAAGLFGSLALGLQLSAYAHAQISAVETIKRAAGGGMALILGRLSFSEDIDLRAVAAVGVMTVGTVLVLGPFG